MTNHSRRSGSNTVTVVAAVLAAVLVLGGAGFAVGALVSRSSPDATARPASGTSVAATASVKPTTSASSATSGTSAPPSSAANAPVVVSDPATDQVVPVLMYHHVMPNPSNFIAISPATFGRQMQWLADHRYHPVTIAQLTDFELTGKRLPAKPVLITFDDGRMNQFTYAVPILRQHGFAATFFVVKKWVDSGSSSFMHVPELRQLSAEGFDIQSHTTDHMMMHRVKLAATGAFETYEQMRKRLWYPANGMRVWLSRVIGKPVTSVAYPGGVVDRYGPRLMRDAGYTTAFSTDGGPNRFGSPSPLRLNRDNPGARGISWDSWLTIFRSSEKAAK